MRRAERGGILAKLIALVFVACVIFGIYLLRHPILRFAGEFWVDDDYSGDRAARAAELYRQGWAPVVVASGRMLRPYAGIAELETHDLEADGVSQSAILQFPQRAEDTAEEAIALRGLIAQHGWHSVMIVTSNYHTRRAQFIFGRVLPADVESHVASAADASYDPGGWWYSRQGIKIFTSECVAYLVARWELRGNSL
jgi:uncharacterized SAM-binding protein YcdF (DUF218 family)